MTTAISPFSINKPLIYKSFKSNRLNDYLQDVFNEQIACNPALAIAKGALYTAITTAGRLPYYNMCFKLLPEIPSSGPLLGTAYSLSWGTLVLQSCYDLESGVRVRSQLADPEEPGSTCAEVAKVVTAVTWSIVGECAFFALAYLANNKSVPMLICSTINAAIPTYSIYLTINAALRERRFSPEQKALKEAQGSFIAKLDQIIACLPVHENLEAFKNCQTFQDLLPLIESEVVTPSSIHITQKITALFLAAVYLGWVGFLTDQGGLEIAPLQSLWITCSVIAVLANAHFMLNNMLGICKAVPHAAYNLLSGERIKPFSEIHYPLMTTSLKTIAIAACLLSFGPASVVSQQNLPAGWDIASSLSLSASMTLAPILPMTSGIDRLISLYGERYSEHKEDFSLLHKLQKIRFIIASASETAFGSLTSETSV